MKKIFFLALAIMGMTAACQKPDNTPVDDNSPVAIEFGVKAPSLTVTKTKAAVDNWNNTEVMIVGYSGTTVKFAEMGTIAAPTSGEFSAVTFNNTQYYDGNTIYDFRGLYLGESASYPSVTDLSAVPASWNGTEDIMVAKTNRDTDVTAGASDNVTDGQIYSAYSARRNVKPSLTFKHLLTRVKISISYANRDPQATNTDNQVEVTNVAISSKTSGTINLTAGTLDVTNGTAGTVSAVPSGTDPIDVMIEPDLAQLDITLTVESKDGNSQDIPVKFPATAIEDENGLKTLTAFAAGDYYNLTIKVYDLQTIEVSASVTKWEDGGDGEYDPDDYFFN